MMSLSYKRRHLHAHKFSRDASYEFNMRMRVLLTDLCRDLADHFGDNLYSIIIAGTYGRGTGGVYPVTKRYGTGVWSIGQAPGDDLDLFIVLKAPAYSRAGLEKVIDKYKAIIATSIDLKAVITKSALLLAPARLEWFELVRNHIVLYGDEDVLAQLALKLGVNPDDQEEHALASYEAVRVLVHAGLCLWTGFMFSFSEKRLKKPLHLNALFIKAALASGNSLLIAASALSVDHQKRHNALEQLLETWPGLKDDAGFRLLCDCFYQAFYSKRTRRELWQEKNENEDLLNLNNLAKVWTWLLKLYEIKFASVLRRWSAEAAFQELALRMTQLANNREQQHLMHGQEGELNKRLQDLADFDWHN